MKFENHIGPFKERLKSIRLDLLPEHPYSRQYLQRLLRHQDYYLSIYAKAFNLACSKSNIPVAETCLLDYGSGNGLLGLFAKFSGFGEVVLLDHDREFMEGAMALAKQLHIDISAGITGDINDCGPFRPNIIIGTDVIEHVYNPSLFFQAIRQLNPEMVTVFSTSSNPENPMQRRKLEALQRKDEYVGLSDAEAARTGDRPHPPYLRMRESMIRSMAPQLTVPDIRILAELTRGMRKDDISEAVSLFLQDGSLPATPSHPYNTCHPGTGSWTERLLSLEEYTGIYKSSGFQLECLPGFYDSSKAFPLGSMNAVRNLGVNAMGLRFAPFIYLLGYPGI